MPTLPLFPVPLSPCMRRSSWGWVLGAALLVGCAAPARAPHTEVASAPGGRALAQLRLQLAALHWEEGRGAVALQEIDQALAADPAWVDAWNLQGWIRLGQNDVAGAGTSFRQALSLDAGNADTLYNLAWLECQQKRYPLSDGLFEAALARPAVPAPARARTWMAKAVCLRHAGALAEALQAIEKAAQIAADDPVVAYNFADIVYAHGDLVRANAAVQRLHARHTATAASLWLGLRVAQRQGDAAAVQQWADQLHKQFPGSQEWQRFERGTFDD